ncbi:TetR family transcriptional regulator [Frankia sp. CNm7]|uniref:TetR family transcriptional regulator n=1 Tax=Frankia nepalensis TaxID=1836974 RepID=A0A937UPZ3_9ACTN|nr:TetR family transcriptional regulator C-terminal domain-containing protein [Frankia nepalensis]MBL7498871.1 TetR family transcriptional regulator [Frankia nepalensis]MBL7513703.1 TetR family transcriptional regulator [Frankia nepalensis]MBL7522397.1 TetR family transcriptional regulator [Frankia nepalensis]MBL7631349.1 TetR family transcriptional regulator [Frankia nepalensis]
MPRTIDRDARKAQLAEAVWRIVVERGIGAVSVRTVAEQAGVVVGSLRHVFPTRAELLEFSAELAVERASARIRATPQADDPLEYAFRIVRHLLPLEPDSRAELEIWIALLAESPVVPRLAAIRDEANQQVEDLCIQVVEFLTARPRDERTLADGRRLHALVDGLAFHLLTQPRDADPAWATDLAREELTRLAAASSS